MNGLEFIELLQQSVQRPKHIGMAQRVHEGLISEYSTTGYMRADLQTVAEALHKTPRTLQRRMESCDTCFSTVLDQARMWISAGWLIYTNRLIIDLFHRLGYQDRTSLSNAFIRNFCLAPSEYRNRATEHATPRCDALHAVLIAGEKSARLQASVRFEGTFHL